MNLVHFAQRKTERFEPVGRETITRKERKRPPMRHLETRKPPNNRGFRAMPYASYLREILFEGVGNGRGGGI